MGMNPFSFHVVNVLIHAFNSGLVTLVSHDLFSCPARALLAGCLFAAHTAYPVVVYHCVLLYGDVFVN